MGRKT